MVTWRFGWVLGCVALISGCGEAPENIPTPAPAGSAAESAAAPSSATSSAATVTGILPSQESIKSGEYTPLSRPLFVYVNKKAMAEKPQLAFFVQTFLGAGQAKVTEVGYIPLAEADLTQAKADVAAAGLTAEIAADKVEGAVEVDGSSTVFVLSQEVAKEVIRLTADKVNVTVGKSGTGGGFKKFVKGETDVNGASRPITEEEKKAAAENGIEYVGFKVALDGISIVVHPENDWLTGITVEQLKAIWNPDTPAKKWKDVDPSWPDAEIALYGADADSGTFDFFTEVINGKAKKSRTDYTASGNDNDLVRGVGGDKYSLGYIPFAYYVENKDSLKLLGVVPAAKKE
jgi:phosphate transport system substrate-binding protein